MTLTAEAGVILSKATAGATFEVTVKYQRDDEQTRKVHDGARSDTSRR